MRIVLFAGIGLTVLALLVLVHRWLWIRLVRDTTRPRGTARRIGTALAFALPLLSLAALTAGRAGAPFRLQQSVAWPGYMWLAILLYLSLAMLVAEPVRAFLLRREPRTAHAATGTAAPAGDRATPVAAASAARPAPRAPAAQA
ncbi:metallophosphoesterase, partial [Streptomyces sp. NPDC001193]